MRTIGLLLFIISLTSCNTTDPLINNENYNLEIDIFDASATEIFLKLSSTNLSSSSIISLYQNNQPILNLNLTTADTIVYIDSLIPKTNYSYEAIAVVYGKEIKSNLINVTTIDTTGNDFTWEVYTFGDYQSNGLSDVTVLNNNSVWAVGSIYFLDLLGQLDPETYGALYWDGYEFNFYKVPVRYNLNPPFYSPAPISASFEVDNRFFVTSYANLIERVDGNWIERGFFFENTPYDKQILALGGTSSNDLYCVGRNGAIFNVTETGWKEIESNTAHSLYDIWAYKDPNEGKYNSLIVATDEGGQAESFIIRMVNGIIKERLYVGTTYSLSAWTNKGFPIYVGGLGIRTNITGNWEEILGIYVPSAVTAIRGTALNDIFFCAVSSELYHYNGAYWKKLNIPGLSFGHLFGSISVKGNVIAIAGEYNEKALLIIGKRN